MPARCETRGLADTTSVASAFERMAVSGLANFGTSGIVESGERRTD